MARRGSDEEMGFDKLIRRRHGGPSEAEPTEGAHDAQDTSSQPVESHQ